MSKLICKDCRTELKRQDIANLIVIQYAKMCCLKAINEDIRQQITDIEGETRLFNREEHEELADFLLKTKG